MYLFLLINVKNVKINTGQIIVLIDLDPYYKDMLR